jgi:hypothetical protein
MIHFYFLYYTYISLVSNFIETFAAPHQLFICASFIVFLQLDSANPQRHNILNYFISQQFPVFISKKGFHIYYAYRNKISSMMAITAAATITAKESQAMLGENFLVHMNHRATKPANKSVTMLAAHAKVSKINDRLSH